MIYSIVYLVVGIFIVARIAHLSSPLKGPVARLVRVYLIFVPLVGAEIVGFVGGAIFLFGPVWYCENCGAEPPIFDSLWAVILGSSPGLTLLIIWGGMHLWRIKRENES